MSSGIGGQDPAVVRQMLSDSGYSDIAIDYFLEKRSMGSLSDASQVSELTGHCGDTMKVYLKVKHGIIKDAKIQVLGCPGAISAAMAGMELIKGKSVEDALALKDRDIFRVLKNIPDKKQHCIRLAVKTITKGLNDYQNKNGISREDA